MQIRSEERLEDRGRDLAGNGLNGMRLVYVTLEATPQPSYATLEVEFYNNIALGGPPPAAAFRIAGAERRHGGNPPTDVHVVAVQAASGSKLQLRVSPVGDYSTYVLATVVVIDPVTGLPAGGAANALPRVIDPVFNELPFKFRPGCFNINCKPEWPASPPPPDEPPIDYLARDYDSFRHVLITAMSRRVAGWQPTSEADLDEVLIDLIAADADEQADYHDRVMAERSIATARKRVSLARHARLMDYHIHQGNQASTPLALEVMGNFVDLPALPAEDFTVWTGRKWNDPGAVIFALPRSGRSWRRRVYDTLNRLRFYTWSDTVVALGPGTTEADIVGAAPFDKTNADELRDLLLGNHPDQAGPPPDVATAVDRLLLEEILNPDTGNENGRSLERRRVVRLLPKNAVVPRAESMVDPFTGLWFVRVRWIDDDRLDRTFCISTECRDPVSGSVVRVDDVTILHGNLVDVAHGRPAIADFFPPPGGRTTATPSGITPSANDRNLRVEDILLFDNVPRQSGPSRGIVCGLPRAPLAYRSTDPGGDVPVRTTLDVRVARTVAATANAGAWREQSSLVESRASDEDFIVETDEFARSIVRFGDGVNGASVPTDRIVRCRYQFQQGVAGNVGADTLTAFDYPGSAIFRVWNPLDVRDGRDPEPVREIVRRVPEHYRRRQRRAVTLEDYANSAKEVAGVAHARARYAWTGSWRTVRVVIDPIGTTRTDPTLLSRVGQYLDAVRLIGEDLEIRPAEYVPLDIRMRLCADSRYWPEDLRIVLGIEFSDGWTPDGRRGFFHPDEWTFGQDVWASRLIGRALAVTGVERVLSLSMRRWNPGTGGGLSVQTLQPNQLPENIVDVLSIGPFEIAVVANDPDHLETGRILFDIVGGRR